MTVAIALIVSGLDLVTGRLVLTALNGAWQVLAAGIMVIPTGTSHLLQAAPATTLFQEVTA